MSATKQILLVEDEENFGSLLQNYLQLSGYAVKWCKDGAKGYSAFKNEKYDLCILDVMMPIMDGFTLAEKVRETDTDTPIIFLTARDMKEDMIRGYTIGADDYLNKPFDVEVLLLKLDVLFKKEKKEVTPTQFQIGNYQFDTVTRMLKNGDVDKKLSPKEGQLLQLLCEHQNDVLPREKALKTIWKEDSYFTTRSMDVYIAKLRKYLNADDKVRIENVHSKGYGLFIV